MRISDWSSDVCSSDLRLPRAGRGGQRGGDALARLVLGQRDADHPGRADEYLARRAAEMLRDLRPARLDRLASAIAGEGVAVARLDDNRAAAAALPLPAAQFHPGRAADIDRAHPPPHRAAPPRE